MTIKLVAMDLDDTLLREDCTISPRTVATIREARAKGVLMTIATGRMPVSARPYAEELGLDIPVITYHGAIIQQVLSGEILFRLPIPGDLAGEIIAGLHERGIHCHVYIKNRVITQQLNQWSATYAQLARVTVEEEDLTRVLASEGEGVDKILIMGEEPDLDNLAPVLNGLYGDRIHATKSKAFFLELVDKQVNKAAALAALAGKYDIAPEEIMAIGDSFNDLEMIQFAGLGVAMGNARPEVQALADAVTATNQEDGVAQAIEKYVLKKCAE